MSPGCTARSGDGWKDPALTQANRPADASATVSDDLVTLGLALLRVATAPAEKVTPKIMGLLSLICPTWRKTSGSCSCHVPCSPLELCPGRLGCRSLSCSGRSLQRRSIHRTYRHSFMLTCLNGEHACDACSVLSIIACGKIGSAQIRIHSTRAKFWCIVHCFHRSSRMRCLMLGLDENLELQIRDVSHCFCLCDDPLERELNDRTQTPWSWLGNLRGSTLDTEPDSPVDSWGSSDLVPRGFNTQHVDSLEIFQLGISALIMENVNSVSCC